MVPDNSSLATPAINIVGRLKCWWPPWRAFVSLWNISSSTRCATNFKCRWNVCELSLWKTPFGQTNFLPKLPFFFSLPQSNSKLDHPHLRIIWLSKTNYRIIASQIAIASIIKNLSLTLSSINIFSAPFHFMFLKCVINRLTLSCYALHYLYALHSQGSEQLQGSILISQPPFIWNKSIVIHCLNVMLFNCYVNTFVFDRKITST